MTPPFEIVKHIKDWKNHDQQRDKTLLALKAGEALAKRRKLKDAAERFCPSAPLLDAINAALVTRTPLLLTGEAGTGKTQVAWYLKRYFDIELFEYQVNSNSQAKDMRYDFDAVAYLRDAYLTQNAAGDNAESNTNNHHDRRTDPRYLKKRALWEAYDTTEPCILLIDEVDKAPRDFPNDLLQELDQNRFEHPFNHGEHVECKGSPPITIITSNGERRLPDAFLRRCMVHHIELDKTLLKEILNAWDCQFPNLKQDERDEALIIFKEIRTLRQLSKKPGTAELLLWLSVLSAQEITYTQLKSRKHIPALECLIKDQDDKQQVKAHYDSSS
ncbi:MAG TPA: MoxR family ATPase [Leucothrix mucor]|nr:MoxR family ATPase [Leucothrix mucor]